jgi:ATP-binding cassette subfamily C (CFTR/MRP) protein 1
MLTGTIRENLDPFQERTDSELWKALRTVQLEGWVRDQGDGSNHDATGLQALVTEAGGNMSVGQRQLICLARALLKRPRVLILDEATASVDYETDRLIQQALRSEFDCTVLTIAHRLNTIMDVDRIIVLSSGHVLENGSPTELLAREGGVFKDMVETTE